MTNEGGTTKAFASRPSPDGWCFFVAKRLGYECCPAYTLHRRALRAGRLLGAPKLTIPQPSRWSIEVADARFVHPSVFHELDDAIEPGCLRRIDEILTGKPVAAHW